MSDRTPTPTNQNNNNNNDKQNDATPSVTQDFRQNHTRTGSTGQPPPPPTRSVLPPQPHELTAEWTVRAQLTFARAGEHVEREFSSNDPVHPVRVVYKWSTLDTTPDLGGDDDDDARDVDIEDVSSSNTLPSNKRATTSSSHCSGHSTSFKGTPKSKQHESFRSTTSSAADLGGADSAFSGSNTSKKQQQQKDKSGEGGEPQPPHGNGMASAAVYGTRCRSTCNIVVSAVADFLPADAAARTPEHFMTGTRTTTATDFIPEEEPDPFVYNTTASYTVLPEKSFDETATSKNFTSFGKILALRDAFSQTSDSETKYLQEQQQRRFSNSRSPVDRRQQTSTPQQRRNYEQRRATAEALCGAYVVDEGSSFMPSYTPSPTQTFKSASLPRIPPLPGQQYSTHPAPTQQKATATQGGEPQKKPRTVHIDVYCTGSDDDDEQADAESSSSSDAAEGTRQFDLDSNSTPQTVFDNEQMLLRHQRVMGKALPRRVTAGTQQQQQQQPSKTSAQQPETSSTQSELQLGHAVTKSSTAEEVSESKQLLFRKHIGDQRSAKLQNLRQKYMRQPSDDAISSTYPSSSRSTVRDATCSSISSAVPSSHAADYADSSWKETEEIGEDNTGSLAKSDSFDYEHSLDRVRIKQMERFWSRDGDGDQHLQTISEGNSQRASPFNAAQRFQRNDTLPSESENYSETDYFYTYPGRRTPARQWHQNSPASPPPPVSISPTSTPQMHFLRNRPGFLQFFGPQSPTAQFVHQQQQQHQQQPPLPMSAPILPSSNQPPPQLLYPTYPEHLQRWKSETRDNLPRATATSQAETTPQRYSPMTLPTPVLPMRCGSEAPPSTYTTTTTAAANVGFVASSFLPTPSVARRFEMKQDSPAASEASTIVTGYTTEYLEKARKFGKVVSTARKPGHHVGPTKNPSCSCESCTRWMAERFQLRGRAFSLGERPILKRPT